MVSLESQSTPREVGSEYGAWSGASDGLHTAGEVPPPPRGTPLSFVWRAKWVVLVLVVVCGAAALLALMRAVPASLPQSVESVPENGLGMDMRDVNGPRVLGRGFPASSAAPRPMRARAEPDVSGVSTAALREWQAAQVDHAAIALAVAQCQNVGSWYVQPSLNDQLMLGLPPSGDGGHLRAVSLESEPQGAPDRKPLQLASFQRTALYLSNAIARARIETAGAVTLTYAQMQYFQLSIIILGAITTILISIKSISRDNTRGYMIIGIAAIIFSSLGTATAALHSFYSPREGHIRNQRFLSQLKQLHVEVATAVNSDMDADKCSSKMSPNTRKKFKEWSTQLVAILNASETAAQSDKEPFSLNASETAAQSDSRRPSKEETGDSNQ